MLPHQLHAYYLREVKQPHRNHTVAKASADYHLGAIHIIFTCCIFGKKSLIRSHYPADKRQSELSAVGMSGKHEINTGVGIPGKVLWLMCKNDRELLFITKQRLQCPIRKTFIVQSDQPELRIPPISTT